MAVCCGRNSEISEITEKPDLESLKLADLIRQLSLNELTRRTLKSLEIDSHEAENDKGSEHNEPSELIGVFIERFRSLKPLYSEHPKSEPFDGF